MSSASKTLMYDAIQCRAKESILLAIEAMAAQAGDRDTAAEAGKLIVDAQRRRQRAEREVESMGYRLTDFTAPSVWVNEEAAAARKLAIGHLRRVLNLHGITPAPEVESYIIQQQAEEEHFIKYYSEKRIEEKISSYPTRAIKIKQTAAA